MATLTKYDEQAEKFCKDTGLTIKKEYVGHRPYFDTDEGFRAVWSITLEREGRKPYTFTFGASFHNSYGYSGIYGGMKHKVFNLKIWHDAVKSGKQQGKPHQGPCVFPQHPTPSDYDILSCLEKRACSSFSDFCDNFGYDTDSIKARDTYIAVQEQAAQIERLFTDDEVNALEDIA